MSSAQHPCANQQHKAFVGIFVPHNRLLSNLEDLQLELSNALRQSVGLQASKRQLMCMHAKSFECLAQLGRTMKQISHFRVLASMQMAGFSCKVTKCCFVL